MTDSHSSNSARGIHPIAMIDRIRSDRHSLAKAITVIENNFDSARDILAGIQAFLGHAHVVGVTGPPGVGKSTLIDACIHEFRNLGKSVAVLAVDPSSHLSGGALLGDRVRMAEHTNDDNVFIRSVAARGHLGGLSTTTLNIVHLFDAASWDLIVVETVGTGQSEIDICAIADTTVVVASPGLGDEIQAIKAGLIEIADIVAINKSDQPNADLTVSEFNHALALRHAVKTPEVIKTCATEQQGIDTLVAEIIQHGKRVMQQDRSETARRRAREVMGRIVGESIANQLTELQSNEADEFLRQVQRGDVALDALAKKIVQELISIRESTDTGSTE